MSNSSDQELTPEQKQHVRDLLILSNGDLLNPNDVKEARKRLIGNPLTSEKTANMLKILAPIDEDWNLIL